MRLTSEQIRLHLVATAVDVRLGGVVVGHLVLHSPSSVNAWCDLSGKSRLVQGGCVSVDDALHKLAAAIEPIVNAARLLPDPEEEEA